MLSACHSHSAAPQLRRAAPAKDAASSEARRMFIFGLGYTGLAVANQLQKRGWHVEGTCRSEEKQEVLRIRGFTAHRFNPDDDESLRDDGLQGLLLSEHVLSTVPPVGDFGRDPVLAQHRRELIEMRDSLRWVGYLSSTSVYGDHSGGWVDESSELRAVRGTAAARLRAEQDWLELGRSAGLPVHVFRLGGIYGPGRSALDAVTQRAQSASQLRRRRRRYTARCHVHDVWQAVHASVCAPQSGVDVVNVVDDDPAPRHEVMQFAAELLGKSHADLDRGRDAAQSCAEADSDAVDKAAAAETGDSGRSSVGAAPANTRGQAGMDEKRVSNQMLKTQLGVTLRFSTYREGLQGIHEGDQTPFD